MRNSRQCLTVAAMVGLAAAVASPATAQKKYDPGASDREIKIGNTAAYSGPASAIGEAGKTFAAYFNKINAEGGINAAGSPLSAMTTPTARQKRSSRRASSLKATRSCLFSVR
jgi:hypothetical protein